MYLDSDSHKPNIRFICGPLKRKVSGPGLGLGYNLDLHMLLIAHFYLIVELSGFRTNKHRKQTPIKRKLVKLQEEMKPNETITVLNLY